MKKLLLGSVAWAALVVGPAMAADLPMKAPALAPAIPTWSWAGFYIGGHGGYGWKRNDFQEFLQTGSPVTIGGIDSKGWVYGGQVGYNWQYNWFVGGLEVDVSGTNIKGDSAPATVLFGLGTVVQTNIRSDEVKLLGTARGRVGYAFNTGCCWNALLYGTGGLAWERVNRIDSSVQVGPGSVLVTTTTSPRNQFGWVAGIGGELQVANTNWIARVEWLHYDFGQVESSTVQIGTASGASFADNGGKQTINVVRGALSYKFAP